MEITVEKEPLARALHLTQGIVERKTTMPILLNLLLTVDAGSLQIASSDLEVTAISKIPVEVKKPGKITVNAKVFSDIVRELPNEKISIVKGEGERLEIICGPSSLRVVGVSAEEFPGLPGLDRAADTKIKASEFSDMIQKTVFAVSSDETRFNLTGVCFAFEDSEKDQLKMVATDGHRLAHVVRSVPGFSFDKNVIVPKKGLVEIKKVVDQLGDTEVGVGIDEGFVLVESADTKVSVRLVDGEFPDYSKVVPDKVGDKVQFNSEELIQALRRVSLLVTDKTKCVQLDFAQDTLRISSSSPELGDAKEELPIQYSGDPISMGFNSVYLVDVLSTIGESQEVTMELNGSLGPVKVQSQSDESSFCIVMPMRLT